MEGLDMAKIYTVTFLQGDTGQWVTSRLCQTLRAARQWAAFLMGKDYVREVAIYRGGIGGERVTL